MSSSAETKTALPGSRRSGFSNALPSPGREVSVGFPVMPSEAHKYWQYSQECTKQAVQAATPQLRDQLLDLARMWTEAASREELNSKRLTRRSLEFVGLSCPSTEFIRSIQVSIIGPPEIVKCEHDSAAVERAKQLLDGKCLEVWDGPRRVAVMGQILKFIHPDAHFDPETTAALGAAFDRAINMLDHGRPPAIVKEVIAKRIVTLAAKGERNPDRLCEAALAALGAKR